MADWQTLSSEEVYSTPWISVKRDEVLNHNGKPLTYSVVKLNHPSVFVVATNSKNELLLQNNYRYTINQHLWEIPAGHSDGEDPLRAAKRELQEEANLASDDWKDLGTLYQAVGIGNIPMRVFWARNVHAINGQLDDLEDISQHHFVSPQVIESMIERGEIIDAPVLAALYLVKSQKE